MVHSPESMFSQYPVRLRWLVEWRIKPTTAFLFFQHALRLHHKRRHRQCAKDNQIHATHRRHLQGSVHFGWRSECWTRISTSCDFEQQWLYEWLLDCLLGIYHYLPSLSNYVTREKQILASPSLPLILQRGNVSQLRKFICCRIDYIYASNTIVPKISSAVVVGNQPSTGLNFSIFQFFINTSAEGIFASDHFGVMVTFNIAVPNVSASPDTELVRSFFFV